VQLRRLDILNKRFVWVFRKVKGLDLKAPIANKKGRWYNCFYENEVVWRRGAISAL